MSMCSAIANEFEGTMKLFEIKHRFSGAVLFSLETTSLKLCVEAAIKSPANLVGANLSAANLSAANLVRTMGARLAIAMTRILPEGDLVGWKKCNDGIVVKLRIPSNARRSHAFGRKCRAEFAVVLEIMGADVAYTSNHGPRTEYKVGQCVAADSWDEDFQNECSHGIHFFITKEEAESYT